MIFENLQRQQAIVTLNGKAQLITTPTLPIGKVDHRKLDSLEAAYAKHLLTPINNIGKENISPRLYLVPSPETFKRRTLKPSQTQQKPCIVFSGDLEQDILTAVSHVHFITLDNLLALLSKKEGNKNYLRKKLNDMVDNSKLAITQLPRVSGGKPLQVFFAHGTGERKQVFLEHTLDCSAALVAGFHVPSIQPFLSLVDLKAERTLKSILSSTIVPDGLLTYQTQTGEIIHLLLEIDRSTENTERIEQKFTGYGACIKNLGLDALTIAFVVTSGDKKRVTSLMEIANDAIGESSLASLFLFAYVPGEKLSPSVFVEPVFTGLDSASHALIEKPF